MGRGKFLILTVVNDVKYLLNFFFPIIVKSSCIVARYRLVYLKQY